MVFDIAEVAMQLERAFVVAGDAFAREKQVQNWSRAKRIALIEGRYDDLNELGRKPKKQPDIG